MATEDPVDLNLTFFPSSRKIPPLLTKNSAQSCQTESCREIMWIRVRPTDGDDDVSTNKAVGVSEGQGGRSNTPKCLQPIRACSIQAPQLRQITVIDMICE